MKQCKMTVGVCCAVCLAWTWVAPARGQLRFRDVDVRQVRTERTASAPTAGAPAAASSTPTVESAGGPAPSAPITSVSRGDGVLPHEHGQKWLEYDISPYTSRVTSTARPEQAIVDWILRETGTEVWFSEPVGLLSASRDKLLVYHTPEMQELIREIVDRFVNSRAESHAFALRLVTIGNPNWRSKALPLMRSVTVQSPGVDAWLLSKENAALLIAEVRKRTDFREHNSPNLVIHNGQSQTISRTRPRNYVRSVQLRDGALPGYEMEMGQIQEGYSLQISPLMSLDEQTVDAVIRCHIDQVEKLLPITIDVPGLGVQRQSVQVQVPQMVSWRLHERFRWPAEQVLLLSCGVVATPSAERANPLALPGLLSATPGRADALLFIESNGKASQALVDPQQTADQGSYRGRY
jgi:hypothetical protein